jgi:thiamine biosynthesis lipoprotein
MIFGTALNRRQFLSLARPQTPTPSGYWIHVSREAMACRFEITLPARDQKGLEAARLALDEIDRLEAQLTVFRDSSEISHINRAAAEIPVAVEPGLFELLLLARQLHRDTDGAFDITAGPLIRSWGFFQRAGRIPEKDELENVRQRLGMSHLLLDVQERTVRFARPGMEINLGSIGKGYALDQVAADLRRHVRTALLSGGSSSVVAIGGGEQGWRVGIRDPRKRDLRIATLRLRDAAIATSGTGEQYFFSNGRRYGHILDPWSGIPASGVLSVTVAASAGAVADALATAFFVRGCDLAEKYCRKHPHVLALVIPEDEPSHLRIFGSHPGVVIEALSE